MAITKTRPLSPHLSIWRWGPHMAVSILHRITGGALTVAGLAVLTWWLWAVSTSTSAYEGFTAHAGAWYGMVVLIGLTWAFFQHLLSGVRHLVMDSGGAFDLPTNKTFAIATIAGSLVLTALTWAILLGVFK